MATIELQHISKVFLNHTAVAPFNLTIEDGEFLVLVGPSGCGKTTTLRMLAGLETPTAGRIFIDGTDITDCEPKDRDIAMVFQNYALYPHMTVYDNMAYALKLRKTPRETIAKAVEKAACMLGLEALLARYPRQLSGGQQQRVALGRAIVRHPKVFLMDEPLSNLDAKLRVQTRAELIQLHSELKATVVYVTHDQVEAMTMGTRIVIMKDGIIQQVGKPIELYRNPVNRFVAEFIGAPPMQFLSGNIIKNHDQIFFEGAGFKLPLEGECPVTGGVYLGIRPENLALCPEEEAGVIYGTVRVVENIGSEVIIHFVVGSEKIAAKIPAPQNLPVIGETMALAPGNGKLHVFDPETNKAVAVLQLPL